MERLVAVVSGRVQMVMYRDFAVRKARGLKLVGEVHNERNGTVTVIAEGPRLSLDTYVEKLHKGPLLARVDSMHTTFSPAQGTFSTFSIRYE